MVCLIKCGGCHGLISSGTPSGLCADCAQREVAALRSRSETAEKSLAEARAEARAALDEARRLLAPFSDAWLVYVSANEAYEDDTVETDPLVDAVELLGFLGDDDPYQIGENWTTKFRAAAAFLRASDEKAPEKPSAPPSQMSAAEREAEESYRPRWFFTIDKDGAHPNRRHVYEWPRSTISGGEVRATDRMGIERDHRLFVSTGVQASPPVGLDDVVALSSDRASPTDFYTAPPARF